MDSELQPGTKVQTIDRVVASIGNVPITQSEVETEYRIEVLLQGGELPSAAPGAATLARVRDRLIDQRLLLQEKTTDSLELSGGLDLAQQRLTEFRKQFRSEEAFHAALRSIDMDEHQLFERLLDQQRTLRMIDLRFRPIVSVEQAEVEAYYRDTLAPQYARGNKGPAPALAEVEGPIREILVQTKINERLEAWLQELRSSHRVRVMNAE